MRRYTPKDLNYIQEWAGFGWDEWVNEHKTAYQVIKWVVESFWNFERGDAVWLLPEDIEEEPFVQLHLQYQTIKNEPNATLVWAIENNDRLMNRWLHSKRGGHIAFEFPIVI